MDELKSGIRLIAFDLDDTLYDSKKQLTPETLRVLNKAASLGIELVPASGRFWKAVTDNVKQLDFIHYAIMLNGAQIYDVRNSRTIARFEIPKERADTMARVFDDLDVIYDCIIDGQGWMQKDLRERVPDVAIDEWQRKIMYDLRKPVDDMHEFLNRQTGSIQKMQIFTKNQDLRKHLLEALPFVFPHNLFTSSVPNNIEINDINANKGEGLRFLADYLGIDISQTMGFGDGLNDTYLIRAAGIGVAMGNACHELKEIADHITSSCDDDGVAKGIKTFCAGVD